MGPQDILQMIFLPGFSTAAQVTNVSGRGVGMDVVKTNIESIGGTIEVESVPGRGTCTRLRIPLTLAIVPALTVECAGDRYAIPQISLQELVSLDAEKAANAVEEVGGAPVYRLRGELLPLVRLTDVLGLTSDPHDGHVVIAVLRSRAGASASSSTASSTPRRSSSRPSAASSRRSASTPARPSSATAPCAHPRRAAAGPPALRARPTSAGVPRGRPQDAAASRDRRQRMLLAAIGGRPSGGHPARHRHPLEQVRTEAVERSATGRSCSTAARSCRSSGWTGTWAPTARATARSSR
jgi:two-component system chemotaxis sensor kinase CheA